MSSILSFAAPIARRRPPAPTALLLTASLVPASTVQAGTTGLFADGFEALPSQVLMETDAVEIEPLASGSLCHYVEFGSNATRGAYRISAELDAGISEVLVYTTYDSTWQPAARAPAGTITDTPCGLLAGDRVGWLYDAHSTNAELTLPSSGGAGLPLGYRFLPRQPLVVELRYVNEGETPLTASARIAFDLFDPDEDYIRTESFVAFSTNLALSPGDSETVTHACTPPTGGNVWRLTTRTHRFGTAASVGTDTTTLVQTIDWHQPGVARFDAPDWAFVPGDTMRTTCDYTNTSNALVTFGERDGLGETCMGIAHWFPADRPRLCADGMAY